ncbi:MAG: HAMP domain-containing protein [Burkholderiales bacterium]|nr:HAMP domain-containing protein [Burkholderiales bacterium]
MRGLFGKYVALLAGLVTLVLLAASALAFWFFGRQNEEQLTALQREKAAAAAMRIELYVKGIEREMGWTTLPKAQEADVAQRKLEFLKLLRQVPAVTDVSWIDAQGRERLRMSRLQMDREESGTDVSTAPFFRAARPGQPFFGPVYFRKETEPYMTIASRPADPAEGVVAADVNLKFVWDVVTQIRVGRTGVAYVVDSAGNLVAHPDISLVLQKTSMPQQPVEAGHFVRNLQGHQVLSASAPVPGLGWNVFVDLPREEALGPLYQLAWQALVLVVLALALSVAASVFLARRMVRPIRELEAGARDIGAGRLDRSIEVRTGDEVEALATQFNTMTSQLRESYATLEDKVEQRTRAAEDERQRAESASLAKSRFLAAASHDLRQPMHALNLYLGALAGQDLAVPARRLLENVRQCTQTMDDLFEGLLDISRLDANTVTPQVETFALGPLLARIGVEFEPQARAKGLRLRVVPGHALVHSDPALVERIVRNLVSNAVRYTRQGHIVLGCLCARGRVLVQVRDTGIGIAADEQPLVFEEFYQVGNPERDRGKGLGLGLSIVQRLAQLLDAPVRLLSEPGKGSMFEVSLPLAQHMPAITVRPTETRDADALEGKLVVVVDDESVVLDATRILLEQWGCEVVPANSGAQAVERLASARRVPDLLVCDYRLKQPENGLLVMEALREEFNRQIPALIITGDVLPESMELQESNDTAVLHKPVPDNVLRDTLARLTHTEV